MRHQQMWAPQWDAFNETRGRGRSLWVIVVGSAFVCVASWVLTHDTAPGVGLSLRSWLTLALAALVVVLLSAYRAAGLRLLLRAVAEYTAVAVLAVLLATTTAGAGSGAGGGHRAAAAADQRPAVIRRAVDAYDFVVGLWHQAQRKTTADQQQAPTTTTPPGSTDEPSGPGPRANGRP
jgi:hypothetical protein